MTDPVISITIELPTAVAHKISETAPGTLEETALIALRLYHGLGLPARTALNEMAEQHKLTPAKTLRLAVEQLQKTTNRLHLGRSAAGRPVVNQDRDAEIYARTKMGMTHAAIAAEFNISLVRVGQIVAKHRALTKEYSPSRIRNASPNARLVLDMDNGLTAGQAAVKYGMSPDEAAQRYDAYKAKLPAKPNMLDRINAARIAEPEEKVLSLKAAEAQAEGGNPTPPTQPKKLAVIPPSMRNPEMFQTPKEIKPIDFDNLDNRIFDEDLPL